MADLWQLMNQFKNNKIAIYGLGTETERVLSEIGQEFQVIGLLDGYKEEGQLYGKPIISLQYAMECQVKLILVVARPGSCRAIVKRIGTTCMENQIALFDVRGRNLLDTKKVVYNFQKTDGITQEQLRGWIHESDAVSIDLFDTLIMRQTLFPTDIFEILEYRLRAQGVMTRTLARDAWRVKNILPSLLHLPLLKYIHI